MALTATAARAAASARVSRYAPGAPTAITDAATDLLTDYLLAMGRAEGVNFGDQSTTYAAADVLAMRGSGAAELLAAWRRPRGRLLVTADD